MSQQTIANPVFDLTEQNFASEVLASEQPILIDFWAPWCGPCRMMKPILSEAAPQLAGIARIAKLNVDEQTNLAGAFGIRSIPTLVLMRGDKILTATAGVVPADKLVKMVKETLANES